MKEITKIRKINWIDKFRSIFKVLTGAFIFSGMIFGGITVLDGGTNLPFLEEDIDDNQLVQDKWAGDRDTHEKESLLPNRTVRLNSERTEVFSNESNSEVFHRYGC